MRILTIAPLGSTHLSPMLPLCWALRTAGHELLVACAPDLTARVHAAGLSAAEVGTPQEVLDEIANNTSADWFPVPQFGDREDEMGRALWGFAARPQVEDTLARFEDFLALAGSWRPDMVLHDAATPAGRLLGAALGVPAVAHRWGVDPTGGPFEQAVQEGLAELCATHGFDRLPDPDLIVDPCPPSLQVTDATAGQPMTYVPFNGTGVLPDWVAVPPEKPRVCVCMGATVLAVAGMASLRSVVDALSTMDDIEVVLAVTPEYRRRLGDVPAHYRVVESLPLDMFLHTCSAVVGAGGSGTGLTAVVHGVPQLVLPQWFDQFDFSHRLIGAHAGLALTTRIEQANHDRIRTGLRTLVDDPAYAQGARRLRAEVAAAPSLSRICAALEVLTPSRPGHDTSSSQEVSDMVRDNTYPTDIDIAGLIALTDTDPAEVDRRLAAYDPDQLATLALTELADRLVLSTAGDGLATPVQFDLGVPGKRLGYRLVTGDRPDSTEVVAGFLDDPWVTVRQELGEFLHLLLGPATGRRTETREVLLKDEPGPTSWQDFAWHAAHRDATLAAHRVLTACAGEAGDLTALATRFGSDKWGDHWYTSHYDRYFAGYRDRPVRVLEIGIGGYQGPDTGGESLRMWKHYFRRGLVYGIDVFAKPGIGESRLFALQGSQNDEEFLRGVSERYGPFDIVIDDGSHLNADVIASFGALFPLVRDGGLYVVEDVATSYWPGWGGSSENLDSPATSMGLLKSLADSVNHQEMTTDRRHGHGFDSLVTGVHFHHNVAVVQKGRNVERPSPARVSRSDGPDTDMTG